MRKTGVAFLGILMSIVLAALPVQARSVFVNGVDISIVRNQTFKNATVRIDDKGDVHIKAPGYKIEVVDDPGKDVAADPPAAIPGKTSEQRFYLVTKPSVDGRAQYDFVIRVNGVERKVIAAGTPQVIMEITDWLDSGSNSVELIARKSIQGERTSISKTEVAEVIIGAGHVEAGVVKIDKINGSLKVNAAQLTDEVKRLKVVVK